ncbi:MAG: DUF1178 family protein [Pseudomonadota bacterium]
MKCANGHVFDAWFEASGAFEQQRAAGYLSCPYCGDETIEKALMAPAVTGTKAQRSADESPLIEPTLPASVPAAMPPVETTPVQTMPEPLVHGDETMRAVVEKMREMRQWVESNADNVGDQFAEKAMKIHYGEEEHRSIFGKATPDEARELIEEGIDFLPLPTLPEEQN